MSNNSKRRVIDVQGAKIAALTQEDQDFIWLTDISKLKNPEHSDDVIRNWLRNRSTVEFLGVWEWLNNPGFNPVEFDGIKKQAGLNSFILTAKRRIDSTGAVGLAKLENVNSVLLRQGLPAPARLLRLSEIAFTQMRTLLAYPAVNRLKG